MPVGHAVTATIERRPPGGIVVVVVPASDAASAPVDVGEGGGGGGGGGVAGTATGSSPTTAETSSTTWAGVVAARRLSVNSFFTSARASLASSLRWEASPPAGAAIRNARSAGPSLAPKSTPGDRRAKASVGVSTPALRQCGIAIPPLSPVAAVASRASASSASCVTSVARPASSTTRSEGTDDLVLVAAEVGVEADQVFGDHLRHGLTLHLCEGPH